MSFDHLRRRQFIAFLGGAAAWPLAARAQQGERMRRIGVLMPVTENDADTREDVARLRSELQKLGWTEGRNIQTDYRWAGGDVDRMRMFAKELVELRPDVLFARSTPTTTALQRETRSIAIVFVVVSDPIGDGLVQSIARPGGNVTGFTNVEASLGGKWLGLLKEIAPGVARVGVMFNPAVSPGGGSYYQRLVEDAAKSTAMKTFSIPARDAEGIERGVLEFARDPAAGLLVLPDVTTLSFRANIIAAARRHRLPAIYPYRFMTAEGGLASYGIDVADLYPRAANYIDRILRGEKPADLPVQQPTKFELAINLKTATALGLTVPPSLLAIADQVIE
jgi:putative tryptophan/tyrosine transport system substrate-binding protein